MAKNKDIYATVGFFCCFFSPLQLNGGMQEYINTTMVCIVSATDLTGTKAPAVLPINVYASSLQTKMRYYFRTRRMAIIKKLENNKYQWEYRDTRTLPRCWWNGRLSDWFLGEVGWGEPSQISQHSMDLPDPGIEPRSPALQADTLTSEPPGKPINCFRIAQYLLFVSSG